MERFERNVERLADWLLDGSVSFRALEQHRTALGLSPDAFSRLLGVSVKTWKNWRNRRRVPLGSRDAMHAAVRDPRWRATASQNPRFELEFEGYSDPVLRVGVPSRTTPAELTPERAPHLYIPLGERWERQEREGARERIRARHRPQPGDDYAGCECAVCGS